MASFHQKWIVTQVKNNRQWKQWEKDLDRRVHSFIWGINLFRNKSSSRIPSTIEVIFHISPQAYHSYRYDRCLRNVVEVVSEKSPICPITTRLSSSWTATLSACKASIHHITWTSGWNMLQFSLHSWNRVQRLKRTMLLEIAQFLSFKYPFCPHLTLLCTRRGDISSSMWPTPMHVPQTSFPRSALLPEQTSTAFQTKTHPVLNAGKQHHFLWKWNFPNQNKLKHYLQFLK